VRNKGHKIKKDVKMKGKKGMRNFNNKNRKEINNRIKQRGN